MPLPPRFVPPTQLDALRALLSGYREGDKTFQAAFDKSLQQLRRQALPELGQRLARNTTPFGLRRHILGTAAALGWPEWDTYLITMLEHEEDLALFLEGCAALGGLCNRRAMQGLQRLKRVRKDLERQEILDREFSQYQPELPFAGCLDRLLEGHADPERARQGARWLAVLARPEPMDVEALLEAFHRGDALSRHLLLHTLAFMDDSAADPWLLELAAELEADIRDYRQLGAFLGELQPLPALTQREKVFEKAGTCFVTCTPGMILGLRENLIDPERFPLPELNGVRAEAKGPMKRFLLKALLFPALDKGFRALVQGTLGAIPRILEESAARADDLANLLAAKVEAREMPLEQVLPWLEASVQAAVGGDDLLIAYLRLLPGEDKPRLERIFAEPEPGRRKRYLEILGAREDDLLAPYFLRLVNDPVKEIGQVAIHQLGKLSAGFPGMMELFRSNQTDRMREAIRFFNENRTKAAVKPLMAFLATEAPDDLLVDAVHALGTIADPLSLNPLLRQLHSGKPLALQLAIVDALARLRSPAASLGLLKKSEELTLPVVLLAALSGSLAGFPDFEHPLPPSQAAAFEHLLERCCDPREGAGFWLKAAMVLEDLHVFDAHVYDRLIARFNAFLVDMRHKPSWDHKSHDQVAEVIKKLSRRASRLSTLEEREKALEASIRAIPESGPKRMQVFFLLKGLLADPEHIMSAGFAAFLVGFLEQAFARESLDCEDVEILCAIAGLSRQSGMIEPLEDLFAHAPTPGLREPARNALLALGRTEQEIDCRKPIRSILLFEPNAFFRNRIVPALEGLGRNIDVAATRQEAQTILADKRVDLLISESHDAMGELWLWLAAKWEHRRCSYLLLSTSSHDPGPLAGRPWVIGRLYKPYPLTDLVKAIED